jgi:EAL domain-containing protein (putative c-di-GMP-specific phosphodiesterase class I)/FixJ family two-component response regulator
MSLDKWKGRSALVVDDSRLQRYEVTCLLQELGFEPVYGAEDGRDALAQLQQLNQIDLVLTDLNMPGMDGVELIAHLETIVTSPLFVAVMSAADRDVLDVIHMIADASPLEVIAVLEKPITKDALSLMLVQSNPDMHKHQRAKHTLELSEEDVGLALAKGELVPFLQPKVVMSDGHLFGFEALVRWLHPEHGTLPPVSFVHHLEQGELALRFFYDFLKASCNALCQLDRLAPSLTCSINMPVALLLSDKLVDNMVEIVESTGLVCNKIIIEVTETTFMSNLSASLSTLARLRLRGFGIAMDDYGTGYSSMQQLSRCPFTEIKIDKEFVRDAYVSPKKLAILTSAIAMSQKLGLKTVAEGVESEQDWVQLTQLGCEIAQGYYLSKPIPIDKIPTWYAKWCDGEQFNG